MTARTSLLAAGIALATVALAGYTAAITAIWALETERTS